MDAQYHLLKWRQDKLLQHTITQWSKNLSQYCTAVAEYYLKICKSMRFHSETPAHTIILPFRNVWCPATECLLLLILRPLITLLSVFSVNQDTSVNITLSQSGKPTDMLIKQFILNLLYWTDKETQDRGTLRYISFICSLRCTLVAAIGWPMDVTSIDVIRYDVYLFLLLERNIDLSRVS